MAGKRLHHILVFEVSSLSQKYVWFKVQKGLAIQALCAIFDLHFIFFVLKSLPIGTRSNFHAALKLLIIHMSYCICEMDYFTYLYA